MKKYKAEKGFFIKILICIFFILPVILFLIDPGGLRSKVIIFITLLLPLALSLWIYLDTYYGIENGKLFYRSAFIRGEVSIDKITEIRTNEKLLTGIKPVLSNKCLIIRFNKYDEVSVSPKDQQQFIQDLKIVNDNIKVR